MSETPNLPKTQWYDLAEIDAALKVANKKLMLEHARLGRSIHIGRGGKVVEVTPTEIFARFGLDENGKPLPTANAEQEKQDIVPLAR
jgi:hypothetical protein